MARRKSVPVILPAIDRSHIVEDTGRAGELVGIVGEQGVYRIKLEALNTRTETEWVELFGPVGKGNGQFRAVRPERIRKVTRQQVRRTGVAA